MGDNIHRIKQPALRDGVAVARALQQSEHQLDAAILSILDLGQTSIERRRATNLAASVGHDALEAISRALASAVETRGAIISAHDRLLSVAETHGFQWRLEGPFETKPTTGRVTTAPEAA